MRDLYKRKWLKEYLDETNTIRWSPEIILADVIADLIEEIIHLRKCIE